MKILIYTDEQISKTEFIINYLREIYSELIKDVILIDYTGTETIKNWASDQTDLTYVYFDEPVTPGSAFNQVLEGLGIKEDILISDNCHIPLVNSYEHLIAGLRDNEDAFAVGPVSNSFPWEQHIEWETTEYALKWSETDKAYDYEEVLYLYSGVILLRKDSIDSGKTFNEEAADVDNMIIEKCIREFMLHGRMYICKSSGFLDIRGDEYFYTVKADMDLLEKTFGIHYLNIRGNDCIIDTIKECGIEKDDDINVLEIGCDCGGTLFRVKKLFEKAKLYGTDINEEALRFASEFAEVRINNIEKQDLNFGEVKFDIIIFGDVLEHLRDPLGTIIFCKKLLAPGGRIVASIPNLMNIEVMKYLLDGYFPYADIGLLDKTHIHMFTYNEIIRMFVDEAGYTIEKVSMNGELSGNNEMLVNELVKLGKAEKFMYQAYQYQIVARLER